MTKTYVKPATERKEDIFKQGNLVVSENGSQIILVTDPRGEDSTQFSGVKIVNDDGEWPLGDHSSCWDRGSFVQFVGTVTLEV